METNQSLNNEVVDAVAAGVDDNKSQDSSPMYWPMDVADGGGDDSEAGRDDPYDSLFDVTSVWD